MDRLAKQLGCGIGERPGVVAILIKAGDLDYDACLKVLGECGFLTRGAGFSLVTLADIPDDLNAQEIEKFLREHGAALCSPRRSG